MSEAILSVRGVNLVFQTDLYRPWTWREAFVRSVKDPATLLPNAADRFHVLKDISFDIHPGDRVALLGVNGVGKTSLCRCLAGFYQPTSGTIRRRGSLRALFDVAIGIQPELTGRENAALLAELMYPGDPGLKALVDEALEFSELGKFLDVPFRLYSKGMQARLGLSLSAVRPADLLVLDEVFDGADMFFREKISARMLNLMDRSGAVIFVSHSADQIRRVCNRLMLLKEGRLIFDGPVDRGLNAFHDLRPRSAAEMVHV